MIIFALDSSCDETAVAVVRNGREVLSSELYSQADIHALYGGVVPEIASRNHVARIVRLSDLALKNAGLTKHDIDAVAVTYTPGLIGALLVGVNFAKGLSLSLDVPLIPVHHIKGHIAANYIAYPDLKPPFLCVVVSGGNSLIADVRGYTDICVVGRSRDDAAGECFDKVARVLGLGYPGGPALDNASRSGNDSLYNLPCPVIAGSPYDMSFSGLKTSVINLIHNANQKNETLDIASMAASLARTVSEILVPRAIVAASEFGYDKIVVAGGVAANSRIRADFVKAASDNDMELFIPPLYLCGDNAAMIGCQGFYEYAAGKKASVTLDAKATTDIENDLTVI